MIPKLHYFILLSGSADKMIDDNCSGLVADPVRLPHLLAVASPRIGGVDLGWAGFDFFCCKIKLHLHAGAGLVSTGQTSRKWIV